MTAETNKKRRIFKTAAALIMTFTLAAGAMFGVACKKDDGEVTPPDISDSYTPVELDKPQQNLNSSGKPAILPSENKEFETYENEYANTTVVGVHGEIKGTVERYRPVAEIMDGGLPSGYPKYGSTLSGVIGSDPDKTAARNALIAESAYLCATGTRHNSGKGGEYIWMDKDGYLFNGTTASPEPALDKNSNRQRQLYKHTAAVGMYLGDVDDNEPGIVKQVDIRPRGYGSYNVTGVYAPAGEVIKIEISEADMNATGGLTIFIGQALYNGQANNIWTAKGQMQRLPVILNTMVVNKNTSVLEDGVYTAYVGSFVGGPLYIANTRASFTATISGGVKYSHFILGYTTREEFEENRKSSAPFFDLEVWNYGVLHSGPRRYADMYSYDDLYKAAVLWEKVSSVTTTGSNQGIVFLYDPFVAAGAAVAFPGRSSVNCPLGWMSNSLNYNTIVTSGAWGNMHEYHHNFQGYGVGNGGEVTNNGMTLVSYALFTKISSKRGLSNFGAQGLGGWNNYTSATLALEETFKIARKDENPSNGNQGLALYATLLHNFGANNYIQAKYTQQVKRYGQNYTGYLKAWQDVTHNDMTYFFKDILCGIDKAKADELKNSEYSLFVPVSSVFQTGRSYMYDGQKKYFKTMQPYVIPFGEDFEIDLGRYTAPSGQYASGSIVLPERFDYSIKNIAKPQYGTIEAVADSNYKFKYTPDKNNMLSGQIIVTLSITDKEKEYKVDDVDLVLEFEQTHETKKMILERTTYSYSSESMYADAKTAYENNFAGYTETKSADHSNPVQNCNTDIWFYPNDEKTHNDHPDSPESHFVHPNTIEVLDGKLYFEEEGTYRIYLRGRSNCAVYYSVDGGKTYKQGAYVENGSGSTFYPNNEQTYFDIELEEHSWVYVKEVLIVQSSPMISYMGLGYGKWTEPMFTMVEKYYDKDGNEVAEGSPDAVTHKTHYYDYQGNEVTEEEANAAELIAPTGATYINAYRTDYEFPSNADFETDYFYKRQYVYNYSEDYNELQQSFVTDPKCPSNFPKENLFDGDLTTSCSSPAVVTATQPWEFTVDLGKTIGANGVTLVGRLNNNASNQNQTPNNFKLFIGNSADDMHEIATVVNGKINDVSVISGTTVKFNFEYASFRYYKILVTGTVQGRFAAIANLQFSNNVNNGHQFSPDEDSFAFDKKWKTEQTFSTFGHVYTGDNGAEMTFRFNGTRLAFMSAEKLGKNFEVYIDGNKVNSIELKKQTGDTIISFMSEKLSDDTHTVKVKCTGKANIDSIITFD